MSDAHLRHLERDAAQGDLQAQARLLLERVRVGDLSQERLRLAAYLGDEASRDALGHDASVPIDALEDWVGGLLQWGWEPGARAAATATELALKRVTDATLAPAKVTTHEAVRLLREWTECPCPAHQETAKTLLHTIPPSYGENCQFKLADRTAKVAAFGTSGDWESSVDPAAQAAGEAAFWIASPSQSFKAPRVLRAEVEVRKAIQTELIPWALGYSDPVRDRVDARQASS